METTTSNELVELRAKLLRYQEDLHKVKEHRKTINKYNFTALAESSRMRRALAERIKSIKRQLNLMIP